MTKLTVGLREAQEMTGVSHFTFRKMIRLGRIKAIRVGRRVLIPVTELEKLAKAGAATGPAVKRKAAS